MESILKQMRQAVDALARFFEAIGIWLLKETEYELFPETFVGLRATALVLGVIILRPAISAIFQKTPTLLEKLIRLVIDILEQLLDATRSVVSERIPNFARSIVSPASYSRLILWASATDHEALAVATSNNSGTSRRLLAPYHGQLILGLVVLLLGIWSGAGLAFAAYMSLRGSVIPPPEVMPDGGLAAIQVALSISSAEAIGVAFAGMFFCMMIIAVDRTIVSSTPNRSAGLSGMRSFSIWVVRIAISVVLASWIAEAYSVILSRHLIEEHLKSQYEIRISELQRKRAGIEQEKRDHLMPRAPACLSVRKQLERIAERLDAERKKCPKGSIAQGECKGPEYRMIQREEKDLEAREKKECVLLSADIPEEMTAREADVARQIATQRAKRDALAYDVAQGSDALQAIGNARYARRHPAGSDPTVLDQFTTWVTFAPHKTFLVLLIIDLLPLIVKMLVKTSYFPTLAAAERIRENQMELVPRVASPPVLNRRRQASDPIFPAVDSLHGDRRTALP